MVQSVTPEDDCKILEKEKKAKRFAYNKVNVKKDPWGKGNLENERNALNVRDSFNGGFEFPKPSQFKGKSLKNYLDVSRSFNVNDDLCSKSSQNKGSNLLEKAWSIKNVPFASSQTLITPTNLTANPSYYSRYKLSTNTRGNPSINSRDKDVPSYYTSHTLKQGSSWNTKQSHFSYSKPNDIATVADNDDEFEHVIPLANAIKNNPYRGIEAGRPMSARTKNASKMHDAYLKSRGLGKYAAPSQVYNQQDGVKQNASLIKDEFE